MAQAKTRAELLTAVRSNLDESTASFWTDTELYNFLIRAKDKVWMEVTKLQENFFTRVLNSTGGSVTILGATYATSNLGITVGGSTLTLPGDFASLKSLEVITSDYEWVPFYPMDMSSPTFLALRADTTQRGPTVFYYDIYGLTTLLYTPLSNTALDTRLTYVYRPADMSASVDLDMPDPLYMAVEEYATTRAQLKDRDETSAVWQQMGNKTVVDCLNAMTRQNADPVFVRGAYEEW